MQVGNAGEDKTQSRDNRWARHSRQDAHAGVAIAVRGNGEHDSRAPSPHPSQAMTPLGLMPEIRFAANVRAGQCSRTAVASIPGHGREGENELASERQHVVHVDDKALDMPSEHGSEDMAEVRMKLDSGAERNTWFGRVEDPRPEENTAIWGKGLPLSRHAVGLYLVS